MKVIIIGANPRTVDIAKVSVRLRWPDASLQSASTARKGLDLIEQEWPNIVVIHPDFKDSSLWTDPRVAELLQRAAAGLGKRGR